MDFNNYQWFITQTVEAMLPRFTDKNIVLTMKIDADWTDYGFDEEGNTRVRDTTRFRRDIFLVFHRPHNYTKVLFSDLGPPGDQKPMMPGKGIITMKQLSDHDSCWREDGMRWIFETFVKAWDFFDDHGLEGRKIDPMFHYSIFSGKPQYWFIENLERVDAENRYGSDYRLEFIRRVSMKEISTFMQKSI